MGRTEPTFRHLLDRLEVDWRDFRRGLSAEDARAFDALFQKARAHASASGNAAPADPLDAAVLAILIEHEKEMGRLRAAMRPAPG